MRNVFILLFLSVCGLFSCSEEEIPTFPVLSLNEVRVLDHGVEVSGAIRNINKTEILEYGIIWGYGLESIGYDDPIKTVLSLDSFNESLKFTNYSLGEEMEYSCRIYLVTSDNIFYSKVQRFVTKGSTQPEIYHVNKESLSLEDTVVVTGRYFGEDPTVNKVFFNEDAGNIISGNDTSLVITVPVFSSDNEFYQSGNMDLFIHRFRTPSDPFEVDITAPEITSVSISDSIYSGYSFDIFGADFHLSNSSITINSISLEIVSATQTEIKVKTPGVKDDIIGPITIKIGNNEFTTGNNYVVVAPRLEIDLLDSINSLKEMTLTGDYLDNTRLNFKISDRFVRIIERNKRSIKLRYEYELCLDEALLQVTLDGVTIQESMLDVSVPKIQNIEVRGFYGSLVDFELKDSPYTNGTYGELLVNGSKVNDFYVVRRDADSKLRFELPSDLITEEGWCHLTLKVCDFILQKDSFLFIPKPEIVFPEVISSLKTMNVSGSYLSGNIVKAWIDNQEIAAAPYPNSDDISLTIPYLEDGEHQVQVSINGQESDVVTFVVDNIYTNLANFKHLMSNGQFTGNPPIAFYNEEKIYIDLGFWNNDSFYSYDLTNSSWQKLADPPIKTGTSSHNADFGYAFNGGSLYRYSFTNNSWETFKLYEDEWEDSEAATSFLTEDKFIYLTVGNHNYRFFDIPSLQWSTTGRLFLPTRDPHFIHSAVGDDNYVLYHNNALYRFNPTTLSVYDQRSYNGQDILTEGCHQGYIYNNLFYFFTSDSILIFNLYNLSLLKRVSVPFSLSHSKFVAFENDLYLIVGTTLWHVDLEKI